MTRKKRTFLLLLSKGFIFLNGAEREVGHWTNVKYHLIRRENDSHDEVLKYYTWVQNCAAIYASTIKQGYQHF